MHDQDKAPLTPEERDLEADRIIRNYMYGSAAAGMMPVALFDVVAITAVQLKMLHSLANLYDVPFTEDMAKSLVASLIGGLGTQTVAFAVGSSAAKLIPVVGETLGAVTLPVLAGAATYAVGHIFAQHFESGGTFLNFDPVKTRGHFKELYEKGKSQKPSKDKDDDGHEHPIP